MKKTGHIYPWREGNQFNLLIDAASFFSSMLQAIEKAQSVVALEMYLFESGHVADQFIDVLVDAARRGVKVMALLDGFGSRGLNAHDRQRLQKNGVELRFYNPVRLGRWLENLARDHRKLLLVDNQHAFIGGAGITDNFLPEKHEEKAWRETMVWVRGPVIADWGHLFCVLWRNVDDSHSKDSDGEASHDIGNQSTINRNHHHDYPDHGDHIVQCIAGYMDGRVASSSGLITSDIRRTVVTHIRAAEYRVWFCTAYFLPSRKLRRALRHAAGRGVDVRLLLPGPDTDHPGVRRAGQRYYGNLLRHGVRIFEYQPRMLHAKTIMCDQWVSIGSSNLDRWNLRWNLEANQNIQDSEFSHQVAAMLETDISNSIECTYEGWRNRSWPERLFVYLWGRIDLWLTSWERKNHRK